MKYVLLENQDEISLAQRKLSLTISREFTNTSTRDIGYPGGTTSDANIFHDEKHWYWTADFKEKGITHPRVLNWVGKYHPVGLHITVELNTPYIGRDNMVSSFFARNIENGSIYLFHSGRVGGGTKGVGRLALMAWLDEIPESALDSKGSRRDGFIVMPIEGKSATASLKRYIDKIAAFKEWVRADKTPIEIQRFDRKKQQFQNYFSEAGGRRHGSRSSTIDYISRHGEIVEKLHAWRKLQAFPKGSKLVKNSLIDLGVGSTSSLIELYEVKTSLSRSDMYTALGQLVVHGAASKGCLRFIVLPDEGDLPSDIQIAIDLQAIKIIRYKLTSKSILLSVR